MQQSHVDVTIIGAGLTGLMIAYLLKDEEINVRIVEARDRLGGRIFTKYNIGQAPQEMGATWLGKKHEALVRILKELNIGIFEQVLGRTAIYEPISTSPPQLVQLPPNNDPSFRIQGGSSLLIQTLAAHLDKEKLLLNQAVRSIRQVGSKLSVKTDLNEFLSGIVVSTLPPHLLTHTIQFTPTLPENLIALTQQTHTWMGDSIKVSLSFETPFWRGEQLSGTIFSNVGPIPEMYDHTDLEETGYVLKGFLNGAYFSISKEKRLELVLTQLEKYYGSNVRKFINYEETVWRKEPFTFAPYSAHVLPHQNNGHPAFQEAYLDGRFFIAGSETAENFPGYMEGAIQSAQSVVKRLAELF